MDVNGLTTLVKYGAETFLGKVPKKTLLLAEIAGRPASEVPIKLLVSSACSLAMNAQV